VPTTRNQPLIAHLFARPTLSKSFGSQQGGGATGMPQGMARRRSGSARNCSTSASSCSRLLAQNRSSRRTPPGAHPPPSPQTTRDLLPPEQSGPHAATAPRHAKRGARPWPENPVRPLSEVPYCAGEGDAQGSRRGKLLSPERRRRAVAVLQERYRASERFICRVVGQHRSTQRHGRKVLDIEEAKLRLRLREIAAEHIRWGRRMAYRCCGGRAGA